MNDANLENCVLGVNKRTELQQDGGNVNIT